MAARHVRRHHDRRRHFCRRPDVRRLFDRGLEGDQRVGHESDAGSGNRLHRSVLCRDHAVAGLRRARADNRRALQPRPARHREKGRRHGQGDGRWRHDLLRPGGRILRVRRRQVSRPSPTTPGFKLDSIELPTNSRHRIRRRQSRPPHRHQERLLPGAAAGFRAGHARRNARGDGQNGRARSRSTITKWRPPSTNSA